MKRKKISVTIEADRMVLAFYERQGGDSMKKQRKRRLLGLLLIGLLALAGCGGAEPVEEAVQEESESLAVDEVMWKANGVLKNTDNFAANFRADVKMAEGEETITEGTVTFVEEPLFMQVDTKISIGDIVQESVTYLDENEEKVNLYMHYNDQWTEMTMDEDDAISNMQIYHTLDNMITLLTVAQGWTLEEDNDGVLEVSAVIPENRFYGVERDTRFFQLAGLSGLSEDYFYETGDVPVCFTVDSEEEKMISYEIDLTKALEAVTNNVLLELNGGVMEEGIKVDSYILSSSFTGLGDVEAGKVPAEAENSAINYEEEYSLMAEE